MRSFGLTARMAVAVSGVAVAFLGAIALLLVSIGELRDSSGDARDSERTLRVAGRAAALVIDAETGVRGFEVTRRSEFLEPLRTAQLQLPSATAQLRSLPLEGAGQRALANSIATAAEDYLTDYAVPLVDALRQNPDAARRRSFVVAAAGKRRVDAIRSQTAELSVLAQREADLSTGAAIGNANDATRSAIGTGIVAVVLLALLVAFLARSVASPIRRTALAAKRLGGGDLATRLPQDRSDEIGQLGESFNALAASLQANAAEIDAQQAELESQNAELERQAVELEQQTVELEAQAADMESAQQELAAANADLLTRSHELEATSQALRQTNERVGFFARSADTLARVSTLQERTDVLLTNATEMVGATLGGVALLPADGAAVPRYLVTRGVSIDALGDGVQPGAGFAGQAFKEQRSIVLSHGDGDLSVESFGAIVRVRHELHAPLVAGGVAMGVLSLGRTGDAPFTADDVEAVEYLADQAASAFRNAIDTERRNWFADMNRAVLNATGEAIRLIGVDGSTLLSNLAMERFERDVVGIDHKADLPLKVVTDRIAARTADPDGYQARLAEILSTPLGEFVDEYELVDTRQWLHRFAAPVFSSGGELIGRIFVLRDTTEQRQAERAKDELMATVSHELRTPLSAILGFAELLMARDYDREERNEYLQTIHEQGTRLAALISDFLDLQRLEQGGDVIERIPFNLADIIRHKVELFAARSDHHPITVESPDELRVVGDPSRIRRVIENLISNAIKYSPEGGPVEIAASRTASGVSVSVTDRGIGIPGDAQSRIFERFYRVDSSSTRRIGGTGLGLALVRDIMRAHGGDAGFESVEGRGSRFWVTLPIEDVAQPETSTPFQKA